MSCLIHSENHLIIYKQTYDRLNVIHGKESEAEGDGLFFFLSCRELVYL